MNNNKHDVTHKLNCIPLLKTLTHDLFRYLSRVQNRAIDLFKN